MQPSLFLKIFVWFVLVMLTMVAGTFMAGELMRPHEEPPMHRPRDPLLAVQGQTAAELFERDGPTGMVAQLQRLQRESGVRAFLFNKQLQELSGGQAPQGAHDLAAQVFKSNAPQSFEDGHASLRAQPVTTLSGHEYVLVSEFPPRPPPPLFFHPIFHLAAVALLGALFCYGLARYLTSPVTKLRTATRELAGGNLGVRVGPSLGNRRDELASLGVDFDLMAQQIETLITGQRRLLGDISHELRSPLARLNVALELARQKAGPEAEAALERIQREAENLNEMIGQLLALTRLESGEASVANTEFDLSQMLREIADDADFEARGRGRSVIVKKTEPSVTLGNYELLRRAIENVVRNAVQYTAPNTAVEVELINEDAGSAAVITVRDHGAGVPESDLKNIFRPFYRVDEARDREAGGVGLGLAIAERAIKLHGGSVKADNAIDGGLLVTLKIPTK